MIKPTGPARIATPTKISLKESSPPLREPKYLASIKTVGILTNSDGWNWPITGSFSHACWPFTSTPSGVRTKNKSSSPNP
jgi:hypothetical protein